MKRYVHRYEAVKVPFDRVHDILANRPCAVLEPAATAGAEFTAEASLALGIEVGSREITKELSVDIGGLVDVAGRIPLSRLSLRWRPPEETALFPVIEADLEIQPMPSQLTLVSFLGIYEPPLGAVGAAVDRLVLYRVAEAAFHRFFDGVVHRIQHFDEVCGDDAPVAR
jgi:hypothetical protein